MHEHQPDSNLRLPNTLGTQSISLPSELRWITLVFIYGKFHTSNVVVIRPVPDGNHSRYSSGPTT